MQSSQLLLILAVAATPAIGTRSMRGGDEVAPKVCLPKNAMPGSTSEQKCGHAASFLEAFAQTGQPGYDPYPEDPAPFGYAERMSKKCKEPKNRPHSFNGAGPPVIYCCHTAQEKVAEFEEKEIHCDEQDLPVPCWKTLVKAIPTYLMYYRSRVADLCGTTTTTSTAAPNSTCTDGKQNGDEDGVDCGGSCPDPCPEEAIVKNVTGNVNSTDSLEEDFHAFCLRKCDQHTKEGSDCKGLCDVLNERHEEILDEEVKEAKVECGAEGTKEQPKQESNSTTEPAKNATK